MQRLEPTLRHEIKISNTVCTADLKQKIDIGSFDNYEFLSSNLELYRCGYVKDNGIHKGNQHTNLQGFFF